MKLQKIKLGFTLIELLVVITIIGILATGAVSVYTSQIQKARDTTRITDMNALKGGLEQAFQDMGMYPGKQEVVAGLVCDASAQIDDSSIQCVTNLWFLNALPRDPKDWKMGNDSPLFYTYNTAHTNWVINQAYEISTWIEADWFKASKASNSTDGWNDSNRIEFWIPKIGGIHINTCVTWLNTACAGDSNNTTLTAPDSCSLVSGTTQTSDNAIIVIRWDCD